MGDRLPLSKLAQKAVADAARGQRRRRKLDRLMSANVLTTTDPSQRENGKEEGTTPPPQRDNGKEEDTTRDAPDNAMSENGADALSVLAELGHAERDALSHDTVGLPSPPPVRATYVFIYICILTLPLPRCPPSYTNICTSLSRCPPSNTGRPQPAEKRECSVYILNKWICTAIIALLYNSCTVLYKSCTVLYNSCTAE